MGLCALCQTVDFNNLPSLPAHYDTFHHAWKKSSGMLAFLSPQKSEALKAGDDDKAGRFSQPLGVAHYQSIDELRKAAAEQCPICRLIERDVSQHIAALTEAREDEVYNYYQEKGNSKGPGYDLWVTKRRDDCEGFMVVSPDLGRDVEVWLLAAVGFSVDDDDPLNSSIGGRVIQEDPALEKTLARALHFVHTCDEQHAGTRCCVGEVELPSRLLDVEHSSSPSRLGLVEPEKELGKYISLSHRWGDLTHFATTRSNLVAYKEGIAIEALPKTFQDAIVMTRRLKIRYLWIDALCICQDDGREWERESAKMASIYSNSYLVLAATGAKKDSEGLFKHRTPPKYETFEHVKDGKRGTLYAFPLSKSAVAYREGHSSLDDEPLSERGWALQERLLGSRLLHFGTQQLYFECYGHFRSEDGFTMQGRVNRIHEDVSSRSSETDQSSERMYRGPSLWYQTLYSYYPRKLTKSTDKLPALSGIARTIEEQTGDTFVAGLWRSALIEGLIWQAMGTRRGATRVPPEYRAPSWSWASIDGPFGNLGLGHDPIYEGAEWVDVASVVEYHIQLKGDNPYGEIASGWLKIKAPIEPLVPSEEKEPDWETVPHKRAFRVKTRTGKSFGSYCMFDTIEDDAALDLSLSALLLAYMDRKNNCVYQALIIVLVEGQQDHYRRVGKILMDSESLGECAGVGDEAQRSTVTLL